MNTSTRTLAGLALASAAVTVALAAPASAQTYPPLNQSDGTPSNARVAEHDTTTSPSPQQPTVTLTATESGVDWGQVAYGAAAGIALTTAAGATLIVVRRRQHLPHHG